MSNRDSGYFQKESIRIDMINNYSQHHNLNRLFVRPCKFCFKPCYFTDNNVSKFTGRRIPIDPDTGKNHCCQFCQYCDRPLVFSHLYVNPNTGKHYPVDPETEQRHQCIERAKWLASGRKPKPVPQSHNTL